ncbi:hypothetical protein ARALYDRAFT_890952 [Arabidopsis lyrata subsp. lyrata]|uniref:F-box domain-containing protein n=1 Tax=Arabidopsis lyrata subsp. lyrata TaxID=81972 RepID=D7KJ93_ARALL|nr:putative F-box protein At1g32660 [Arabidopsis lyrata subsp. lyrata]EFH70038.1 hypothetical protein ARALYDRAFT_890952 [Arabidopsis lyrata subsp. lyrata]|eukprot:XP_002893779.1 putative F-box protein At1g32660 [Arabidopsis lyrata subsp. lyrata]
MKRKNEKDTTNPSKLDLLDSLPLDLKMAILTRLSAKSLKNFRCVSKMWSSIIRSRGFIDSFFSMSAKQSRFIVSLCNIVFGEPEEKLILFFSFSHDEGDESSSSSSLVPNFEMALPAVSFSFYSGSCASLHGILTVETEGQLMMCNPSTEQVVKLTSDCIFVGYDPIDDQYKVLSWDNIIWEDPNAHLKHKVLTLGDGQGWRHIKNTTLPYMAISPNVCINGFLYYGAYCLTQTRDPVMVCFDVRSEKLSFIKAPPVVLQWGKEAVFIEYKGKLASIVGNTYGAVSSFDLWILEDVEKHEWSKQKCVFPISVWDFFDLGGMSFPGTNRAGEIIMAPSLLSVNLQPFYIFYYNVETKNIRRVRLLGIGDSEEFRRSYGFGEHAKAFVNIAHQHVESIAFFKDPFI